MRRLLFLALALLTLEGFAIAAELPEALTDALPDAAAELLEDIELTGGEGFTAGITRLAERVTAELGRIVRERVRGAASILLVVILCGAVSGFQQGVGEAETPWLSMAGALSVTLLSAGSLENLMGLGAETVSQLNTFSKVLLPTLAAASASAGGAISASVRQVATVFFVDLLMNLINGLLMPAVYLYTGAVAAANCLPDSRLGSVAEALKKVVTWVLATALLAFTVYLSAAGIFSASVDGAGIRVAKAAVSGAIPVVGNIIAEASETVLAGAGLLKGAIGLFGTLGILAVCAFPFLQLAVQYLLYKLTAFLAGTVGAGSLCKLIDGLGGAFGLVLGMTGSCAVLLLISVLASAAAVLP